MLPVAYALSILFCDVRGSGREVNAFERVGACSRLRRWQSRSLCRPFRNGRGRRSCGNVLMPSRFTATRERKGPPCIVGGGEVGGIESTPRHAFATPCPRLQSPRTAAPCVSHPVVYAHPAVLARLPVAVRTRRVERCAGNRSTSSNGAPRVPRQNRPVEGNSINAQDARSSQARRARRETSQRNAPRLVFAAVGPPELPYARVQ